VGRYHPPRSRGPSHHRPAVRILTLDARPRARGAAAATRTGYRIRAVFAAGTWLSDRHDPSTDHFDSDDFRASNPRFTGENFTRNLAIADEVKGVADEVEATPAQVAIAWLLAKGDDIAPIPGTKRVARVEENIAADVVTLSGEQMKRLDALTPAAGGHHNDAQMQMIER
jgi:aryl-alcohol dehydrogenase-like predicted oxidoreductase